MTTRAARPAVVTHDRVIRSLQPAVALLRSLGVVRSVEVDDKADRVDVVIRLRVGK